MRLVTEADATSRGRAHIPEGCTWDRRPGEHQLLEVETRERKAERFVSSVLLSTGRCHLPREVSCVRGSRVGQEVSAGARGQLELGGWARVGVSGCGN